MSFILKSVKYWVGLETINWWQSERLSWNEMTGIDTTVSLTELGNHVKIQLDNTQPGAVSNPFSEFTNL